LGTGKKRCMMKIAKEFRWEMGHRLPFHKGKCKNLHGHSYKMLVEFEGELNNDGMVMDYYDVKNLIAPLVEELDHSVMVKDDDTELINALKSINSRMNIVPFHTTAENICFYFLEKIKKLNTNKNLKKVRVWVYETENTYATEETAL
jgi:6-pyruvoyltetrahydropterin/6-carboxytetrahydropterin synthase